MTRRRRTPQPPPPLDDTDDWPVDRGRPWALRLLALLGALAFVMLGLNSLLPALQPPAPPPMPDQDERRGLQA